jgi:endonuclease/exonuclease/phosphatase (EEP) superfamily protein YafD
MEQIRSLVTAIVTLLALICAGWAVAAHGGRWSVRLDVLTHFAPIVLAGALLCLAYAVAFESGGPRVMLSLTSLVGVAAAAALVIPEYVRHQAPPPAAAVDQLKLIQFNAWGRNHQQDATVAWLKAQSPDILVVEEASIIGPKLKAGLAGYHVSCGACSVMIFSKARPVAHDIPVPKSEGRIRPPIAGATFRDRHGEFTVFGTHYTWPVHGGFQQAQGRVIARLLAHFPKDRLILSGDFNSTPWSFSRRREDAMFGLERRTRGLFSWPAGRVSRFGLETPVPLLPIDHVYAGPGWRTVKVERGPRLGSDHYPVIVTLAASS